MEQALYKLPDGWEWRTFNDVCTNITDGAHASPKTVDEGFPYVTVRDVNNKGQIDIINCKRISEDDFFSLKKGNCLPPVDSVLLSKDGTVGKVAHVTNDYDEFVVLSSLAIIVPEKTYLSPEYLKYFLLSPEFQDHAIGSKTGAAIKRIVLRTIKNFNIPIAPLEQQKRIVEKLDVLLTRIDTAIQHLRESVTLTNALYKSCVNQAFNPLNSIKSPYNTYLIPDDWEWISIGELVEFKNGYAYKSTDFSDMGVPVLRISNIQDGSVSTKNMAYIAENELDTKSLQFFIEPGDIVIAMSGATTGKVAVNNTDQRYLQNQRVGRFIVPDGLLKKYIFYYLESKVEENLNKSLGAAQPNLSTTQIKEIMIPTQPKEKQAEIVKKLDGYSKTNKMITLGLNEKISELTALKASILDSAFKGEL